MSEAPRAEAAAGLDLRGLTVERGGRAVVRDVSIAIPAGEVTALLGPNGAGKSSLVLAVGGVLRPQAGSVLLEGRDLAGRDLERHGVDDRTRAALHGQLLEPQHAGGLLRG